MTTFSLLTQLLLLGTLSWFAWAKRSQLKRLWRTSKPSTVDSASSNKKLRWLTPGSASRTTATANAMVDVIELVYCDAHASKSVAAAYWVVNGAGEIALCQHCAHVHFDPLTAAHYHLLKIDGQ